MPSLYRSLTRRFSSSAIPTPQSFYPQHAGPTATPAEPYERDYPMWVLPIADCMTLEKLYADQPDVLAKYSDFKKDKPLMGALCIPGCLAENAYGPFAPTTCCEDDLSTFLCIGADSAFPCNEKIPNTFSCCCPGLFLSPKCACCPKLGDLIGEDKFEVPSNPELAPVVAGEVVDRT